MPYEVTFHVDEAKKRVTIKARGELESAAYIDDCIRIYKGLGQWWAYTKLMDTRDTTGAIGYEDIVRMSQFTSALPPNVTLARVARLRNSLQEAKSASLKILFDSSEMETFVDEDAALAWLDEA